MTLDYFYGQSGELFAYFRIPKALFQDSRFRQLSTDARTLYGILLDRMSLSAKNGWLDEQGRVYIIYTVREVQESLCCAEHKAVKLFRELEQANLIERKRRGLGRPSLIYVKNFSSGLPKAQVQNCANSNSCAAENAVQVQPKPQSNKTDKNKTERNNPFLPDESDREQLEDYFYQALEVELLLRLCPDDEDTIYQIVDLLVDTCSTKRKMLRIAGDDKPTEVVRSRLKKLNADHILRITKSEKSRIYEKMLSMGIRSLSAYIRKMALDGYCLHLDLQELRRMAYLLQMCSTNLNQYAKRANECGQVYAADVEDLRTRLDELIDIGKLILSRLADL